jgi:hypothetical protein
MRTQLDAYYENIGNYQPCSASQRRAAVPESMAPRHETPKHAATSGASGERPGQLERFFARFRAAYLNGQIGRFSNVINQFSCGATG